MRVFLFACLFLSNTTGTPSTRIGGRLLIYGTSQFAVKGGRDGAQWAAAKPPCSGSAAEAAPTTPGAGQGQAAAMTNAGDVPGTPRSPAHGRAQLPRGSASAA